jgi:hypothetical protein
MTSPNQPNSMTSSTPGRHENVALPQLTSVQPVGEADHGDEQRDGAERPANGCHAGRNRRPGRGAVVVRSPWWRSVGVRHGGSDGVDEVQGADWTRHGPGPRRGRRSGVVVEEGVGQGDVFTPAGKPGSTMKRTGISRDSPAASVCSVKQKHSVLLK